MANLIDLRGWVEEERLHLWTELVAAAYRAARTPDPRVTDSWSMEMRGVMDRIQEADVLLAGPASWESIPWAAWPYYWGVESHELTSDAWDWLAAYIEREEAQNPEVLQNPARWVLERRPAND